MGVAMSKRVLWLDNDIAYIAPYKEALDSEGYSVTAVRTVHEADACLDEGPYDLLILDVMIPTKEADEERVYQPSVTDYGHKTGLVFYRRNRERLAAAKTAVLVMTVRLDEYVKNEFAESELPAANFTTKFTLRDVNVFLKKINAILKKG